MSTRICILSLVLLAAACAERHVSILDEELALYRSEQEQYRREELEEMYASEKERCEELTELILELKAEIQEKTVLLGELQAQAADLDAQLEAGEQPATPR